MGAADVAAYFQFLKDAGFDGVRIWPNSPEAPQLMRGDGSLDPSGLQRLLDILDRARERRLIVDVSFTAEHIGGLTAAAYRTAIAFSTSALLPYRNVLIDIENELNLYGPFGRPLGASDVAAIVASINAIDSALIVTASYNQHLPASVAARVILLRASRATHYVVTEYGGGGAVFADRRIPGLWESFALAAVDGGPALDRDRVSVRTSDGRHFLQAVDGGGGAISAAGEQPGAWETFIVESGAGEAIAAGQTVTLRTASDPSWYVSVESGGGGSVSVSRPTKGQRESVTFDAALP